MRILYVLDSFPKLSETFILNEIVELIERGHEVEILALRRPYENSVNEDVLNYDLLGITRYFQLPRPIKLKHSYLLSPEFYQSTFKAFREYFSVITFTQFVRLSYYAPYYKDIDIIHAHFAYEAAVTGMQLSHILDKPFTFTAHAFEIFSKSAHSQERLNTLVKNAAQVITPSEFNKNYIVRETGCDPEKIGIVRATIRLDKFRGLPKTNTDNTKIKILSVGRLVEKKGLEYLIRAMQSVTQVNPSVFLNIIGEGELMTDLKKLSSELGLAKSINFLGAQPNEICIEELLSSDIAVLPSVIAEDGDMDVCPLTLQEAMAMSIPVISTTVGSIPELIEDGKEGILVGQKEEKFLAEAILKLIENPSLRNNIGRKGKDKIVKEFSIKTQMDKLLKIWEGALTNINRKQTTENFDPYDYWSERSKKFGKTAVGNLSKPLDEFNTGTEMGKKKLLPLLDSHLSGRESKLLDFGCGYGRFTQDLADFVSDEAWGIDATPELIEIAKSEKTNSKTFFKIVRGSLSFPDEYFDIIWISYVLEHIIGDEKKDIVKELMRVLKPGGLLFIVVNTVLSRKVKQCDIRPFKWYESAFRPVNFEVRKDIDLKIIDRNSIEKLEKEYEELNDDLVLIMIGRKHSESAI